jgi:hypothetical protein
MQRVLYRLTHQIAEMKKGLPIAYTLKTRHKETLHNYGD